MAPLDPDKHPLLGAGVSEEQVRFRVWNGDGMIMRFMRSRLGQFQGFEEKKNQC